MRITHGTQNSLFVLTVLLLSVFCYSCSTVAFQKINKLDKKTEYFSKEPFPYKFTIPHTDWDLKLKGYEWVLFSSKSVPARHINFVVNRIEDMPYYQEGDNINSLLRKHYQWELKYQYSVINVESTSIIAENVEGPVPQNILCKFSIDNTSMFLLIMIKGKYISTLSSQDFKPYGEKVLLDIFRSIEFLTKEKVDLEYGKYPKCED